jgi:two-component system response regulator YesN
MNAVRQRLADEGLEVSAGGQLQPLEPGELPDLYRRISRQLDERLALDEPILLDANLLPRTPGEEQSDDAEKKAIMGSFLEMIRQRQRERFLLKLSEQLHRWRQENIRVAELERFLAMMADTFGEQLSDHDPWSRLKQAEAVGKLMSSASYASFCEELLAWAGEGFELMQAQNKKSSQELFQQIDDYVQMNMYSHLSITDLALKFHVSPSYISRIIKRHSDQTFVHYYMQLKIKEARRLMEDKPELKIKELSDALSFSDQHYFSKVFKEYTGCSPTEYKERLRDEEDQKKPLGE